MLWQLAVRNVRRNWTKSLLGVVGVAIAAGVMTASLSLQEGYPEASWIEHRALMGADIVIYPGRLGVGAGETRPTGDEPWEWSLRRDWGLSDLFLFQPRIYEEGYISPPGETLFFQDDPLPEPLPAGVAGVEPLLKLPGRVVISSPGGLRRHPAPLRARNVALDVAAWGASSFAVRGRWLEPGDGGQLVALAQGNRGAQLPEEGIRPGYPAPGVGEVLTVEVPSLVGYDGDGYPLWDWNAVREFELEVVGLFAFPTEVRPMVDPETGGRVMQGGPGGGTGEMVTVQHYLETEDLFIPAETWWRMWEAAAPPGESPRAYQLNVVLEDMFRAREIAAQLAERLPGATVMTVPEQVIAGRRARGQSAIPADVSALLVAAVFMVAGLLLVGDMYVLVMQRRKEMAILKALGMASGQVMGMILIESILLSIIGAALGFISVRLLVTGVYALSAVSLAEVGVMTLRTGVMVAGASVLVAGFFGLLPAHLALRQTTMEVLRDV
ncbi:MAG: FtsX-like permease family protein [Bacillota bacterium]